MTTLQEAARAYVPKQTKNIAMLPEVSTALQIYEAKGKDNKGEEFAYSYVELNGEEYRVPDIVLKQLKAIIEKKPTLNKFSVSKTGTGLNTQYTVIPLD